MTEESNEEFEEQLEEGTEVVEERWSWEDQAAAHIVDDMGENVLDFDVKDVIKFMHDVPYLKYHFAERLYEIYTYCGLEELRELIKDRFGKEYTDEELKGENE